MLLKKFFLILVCTFSIHALNAQYALNEISSDFVAKATAVPPTQTQLTIQDDLKNTEATYNQDFEINDDAPEEFSYWHEFFKMMLILGTILGAVLILAWFLKGFLNKRVKHLNQENHIKILEKRTLSQKSMIYLIEVGQQQILISDSQNGGVQLLSHISENHQEVQQPLTEALKTQSIASRFSFRQILQKKIKNGISKTFVKPQNIQPDYDYYDEN